MKFNENLFYGFNDFGQDKPVFSITSYFEINELFHKTFFHLQNKFLCAVVVLPTRQLGVVGSNTIGDSLRRTTPKPYLIMTSVPRAPLFN